MSNKKTFTEPVFNYSTGFEFLWDELTVVVSHRGQSWERASQILGEEIERVSNTAAATEAAEDLVRHFPVRRADVEPRVFARVTDNYVELSARFRGPAPGGARDEGRFDEIRPAAVQSEHIDIASATMDITLRPRPGFGRVESRTRLTVEHDRTPHRARTNFDSEEVRVNKSSCGRRVIAVRFGHPRSRLRSRSMLRVPVATFISITTASSVVALVQVHRASLRSHPAVQQALDPAGSQRPPAAHERGATS